MHFEKLKDERSHQSSIRLNEQYRLIIQQKNEKVLKILII
jgi:plasmid maintenance system killer protein